MATFHQHHHHIKCCFWKAYSIPPIPSRPNLVLPLSILVYIAQWYLSFSGWPFAGVYWIKCIAVFTLNALLDCVRLCNRLFQLNRLWRNHIFWEVDYFYLFLQPTRSPVEQSISYQNMKTDSSAHLYKFSLFNSILPLNRQFCGISMLDKCIHDSFTHSRGV